jgi:hypothetical protein
MSVHDNRKRPAYRGNLWRPSYNPNISRWWTAEHDELMKRLIDTWQWHWYWALTEAAVSMTAPFQKEVLVVFQEQDKEELGAWYNKVMKFAIISV